MTEIKNNRKIWIDVAKGFGIICVQIGHSYFPENMWLWVNSFHMPLFFVLSGITFNGSKYSFKEYLFRKIKTIMIPYYLFCIITSLLGSALEWTTTKQFKFSFDFMGVIFGYKNRPLWFLMCLFLTEILFFLLYKFFAKKNYKKYVVIFVGFLIIALINNYVVKAKFLPMYIDVLPNGILYFMIGYCFRKKWGKLKENKYIVGLLIGALIINSVAVIVNSRCWGYTLSMVTSDYGWYILGMLGAISGIIIVVFLSQISSIQDNIIAKIIAFIGYNSLLYYALLQPLATPVADRILKRTLPFYKANAMYTFVTAVILMILAFLIVAVISIPYNKIIRNTLYKKRSSV